VIHVLDPQTIGQIAAGEVIERPASVVKELVENAVDAGAKRITVSIERGGVDRIEVIDDGIGIPPSDLALAVRRHATSKLAAASDLESVGTLGFRGEGLASIAAVARLEIVSRQAGSDVGARVAAHAERATEIEPCAAPIGTTVRAVALFENVPVRREYLRSPGAEFSRISAWLATFALAYPQITFALRHDGKDVWTMPATETPEQRLHAVFGKAAEALIPLDGSAAALTGTISGFISSPGNDRPDRRMQILFVNGRLLRSGQLAGAWTAGYATFAMSGRQPYGVVFLQVPPEHVDPNVHPTKSDVRLRFGTQVFDGLRRAIATTLKRHAAERFRAVGAPTVSLAPGAIERDHIESLFQEALQDTDEFTGPRMRVLAQLHDTYIAASDGDALVLVDQHAAHERIAYEAIAAAARKQPQSEPLLVPLVVDLDAAGSEALERALPLLNEAGLEIEPFGERTYRVTATPAGYAARPFDLRGFLDDLAGATETGDLQERVWASLACHSVVTAGERLEPDEMATLVDRLAQCENSMHCPHGRPTIVRFGAGDLARIFKRA
jgi:DNA mismatch repair protein MutL